VRTTTAKDQEARPWLRRSSHNRVAQQSSEHEGIWPLLSSVPQQPRRSRKSVHQISRVGKLPFKLAVLSTSRSLAAKALLLLSAANEQLAKHLTLVGQSFLFDSSSPPVHVHLSLQMRRGEGDERAAVYRAMNRLQYRQGDERAAV
jgi:hypothetical protein